MRKSRRPVGGHQGDDQTGGESLPGRVVAKGKGPGSLPETCRISSKAIYRALGVENLGVSLLGGLAGLLDVLVFGGSELKPD